MHLRHSVDLRRLYLVKGVKCILFKLTTCYIGTEHIIFDKVCNNESQT